MVILTKTLSWALLPYNTFCFEGLTNKATALFLTVSVVWLPALRPSPFKTLESCFILEAFFGFTSQSLLPDQNRQFFRTAMLLCSYNFNCNLSKRKIREKKRSALKLCSFDQAVSTLRAINSQRRPCALPGFSHLRSLPGKFKPASWFILPHGYNEQS